MKQQPQLRRSFVFLQGPHGSFFPKLGSALAAAGHRVRRINLNGGDHATWPTGDAFRGNSSAWPAYLDRYFERHGITDIILFGDCRPHHVAAIGRACEKNLRIHVFEEGYIRPDWVTLERDGVNGHSHLPRDPDWYVAEARELAAVAGNPPVPSYRTARGWAAFFYYAEVVLQHWRFPFNRSHRDRNPVWEGITFLRRFQKRREEAERTRAAAKRLLGSAYFLFPLQLDSDYQIRVHSAFGGMGRAIEHVVESFARHAPRHVRLAVKEHPLDAGLTDWATVVDRLAARLGIADRIVFMEQGELSELVSGSLGMVTVNSTSGTLALAAGKPVKVLGTAIYDIPRITDQQPIDTFWGSPLPPDQATYEAFYRVLAHRCLIHGAFLSNMGIELLVAVATERLVGSDNVALLARNTPASYTR